MTQKDSVNSKDTIKCEESHSATIKSESAVSSQKAVELPANKDQKPKKQTKWISFRIFCAGAISGCVSRTLTAPLDRIKVLMQADLGGVNYTIRQANAKIWREGGFKAYFKGNGVNCLKVTPENAISPEPVL